MNKYQVVCSLFVVCEYCCDIYVAKSSFFNECYTCNRMNNSNIRSTLTANNAGGLLLQVYRVKKQNAVFTFL